MSGDLDAQRQVAEVEVAALEAVALVILGALVPLTLDPGQTRTVALFLPSHLASGAYTVLVEGTDGGATDTRHAPWQIRRASPRTVVPFS